LFSSSCHIAPLSASGLSGSYLVAVFTGVSLQRKRFADSPDLVN
jgi:hypothetical protein